jgi:hypothetical protein
MAKFDNIPEHPGYYISRTGKLYSRVNPRNHKLGDTYFRRTRQYSLSNGKYVKYYRVEIQKVKYYVHRLVAMAWIPNPNNYPCVGHKDNNPFNNRVSNLYWCTQYQNMQQMVRDGRSKRGSNNPAWVDRDFEMIGELYSQDVGIIEISKKLGLSKHIVQRSVQILFTKLWQERK